MSDTHTHDWTPNGTSYACTQCDETTPACNTCTNPVGTALPTCNHCLNNASRVLDDIAEAANTPYAYTTGIKAIRYDRDMTSGSRTNDGLGTTPAHDDGPEAARIAAHRNINILTILRDPPNVLEPLLDWADSWADHIGEPTHPTNAITYLKSRLIWASSNPDTSDWHQYLHEARLIRGRLRRLVGLAPAVEPVPCVHCGGTIIRTNGPLGLEDHPQCTGCGLEWNSREDLNWVNLTHYRDIPHSHPNTLVTIDEARNIIPTIKRNTLNQWLVRGIITPAKDDVGAPRKNARGALLYRIGDIHERHQAGHR